MTKTGLRIVSAEAMFMVLVLPSNDADALSAVADGEAPTLSLVTLIPVTPEYLVVAGIVFVIVLSLSFLPRRSETTNRWE